MQIVAVDILLITSSDIALVRYTDHKITRDAVKRRSVRYTVEYRVGCVGGHTYEVKVNSDDSTLGFQQISSGRAVDDEIKEL